MRSFSIIILFSFIGNIFSQATSPEFDRIYGPDPLLYNGKKYIYFLPPGTGGHQFLAQPEFTEGEVIIKQIRFSRVSLNYDIYNQQLLLEYPDETGANGIIEVSKAWLDGFHLAGMDFIMHDFGDKPRFYQVLGKVKMPE
jgi:hypothetical protein